MSHQCVLQLTVTGELDNFANLHVILFRYYHLLINVGLYPVGLGVATSTCLSCNVTQHPLGRDVSACML